MNEYCPVCGKFIGDSPHFHDLTNCVDHLKNRVMILEAELAALQERTRWIPVSERLPEDRQEVYARERGGITITHFKYSKHLAEIFRRHYTHWQPLPEPPEKGGE